MKSQFSTYDYVKFQPIAFFRLLLTAYMIFPEGKNSKPRLYVP